MQPIGDTLRRLRIGNGLSQKRLARLVGVTSSYIVLLESGKRKGVSPELAGKLAVVLGVAPDVFFRQTSRVGLTRRPMEAIIAELQQSLHYTELVEVPIRGAVTAGHLEDVGENIEGYVPIPRSEIATAKEVYALRVVGDSLEGDGINDGDQEWGQSLLRSIAFGSLDADHDSEVCQYR